MSPIISESSTPLPRPEHPRPDRYRPTWQNLNGRWSFAFDTDDKGISEKWFEGNPLPGSIMVPFAPESKCSGIGDESFHPICWYCREFDLAGTLSGRRILLHFGAVDYRTEVWLNGRHLGRHVGGYDPFSFDITDNVKSSGNVLVVRAQDDPVEAKCRGKQSDLRYPRGCFYMRVSGIWQTVWLEGVGSSYIKSWRMTADRKTGRLSIDAGVDGESQDLTLEATAFFAHIQQDKSSTLVTKDQTRITLQIANVRVWSPEEPVIYWIDLALKDGQGNCVDQVRTYVGFRDIQIQGNKILLNGKELFLKTALDQGYYPDGLYTPPSDLAMKEDVLWAKRFGLNGIRKHQIVAEPRFYYWCDVLGLLVWGEFPSCGAPIREPDDIQQFLTEWQACVERDWNHPSIITWVPGNEMMSPTDPKATEFKNTLYDFTRRLDPSRPVIPNSGYCHAKTDICDLHVNPVDGPDCRRWWAEWRERIAATGNFIAYPEPYFRPAFADGHRYQNQPVVISETGNWGIKELPPIGDWKFNAYGPVPTVEDFVALYRDFFHVLMDQPDCAGFCYVQLYDVEGEVNGYLTYDRRPKVDPEIIKRIHDRR